MNRKFVRPLAAAFLAACAGAAQALDVKGLERPAAACTDFYRYANKTWLETTEIPADRTFWGAASIIGRANEDMLIGILDEAVKQKKLPPPGPQRMSCSRPSSISRPTTAPTTAPSAW
jgi:putative endopeptidase